MKLLVGLGNPGKQYARTRHNLGFQLTEQLARQGTAPAAAFEAAAGADPATLFEPAKTFFVAGPGGPSAGLSGFSWRRLSDPDLLLVRPERFMNRSGEPLLALLRVLGLLPRPAPVEPEPGAAANAVLPAPVAGPAGTLPAQDLPMLVAYDDLDLPLAALRLRAAGGHGGHNGMRSILSSLGTDRFPRLRIGIGRGGTDAARYVLEEFSPAEWTEMQISLREAAEAVLAWAGGLDFDKCMTRFHSRWSQGR